MLINVKKKLKYRCIILVTFIASWSFTHSPNEIENKKYITQKI